MPYAKNLDEKYSRSAFTTVLLTLISPAIIFQNFSILKYYSLILNSILNPVNPARCPNYQRLIIYNTL